MDWAPVALTVSAIGIWAVILLGGCSAGPIPITCDPPRHEVTVETFGGPRDECVAPSPAPQEARR